MNVEKEKREAIYKAFDSFQEMLGRDDYGHCEECGWKIFSNKLIRKRGLSRSRFLEVCVGFEPSGDPVEGTDCLFVEQLRYKGEINTD